MNLKKGAQCAPFLVIPFNYETLFLRFDFFACFQCDGCIFDAINTDIRDFQVICNPFNCKA